jgi:hypothetical protein
MSVHEETMALCALGIPPAQITRQNTLGESFGPYWMNPKTIFIAWVRTQDKTAVITMLFIIFILSAF